MGIKIRKKNGKWYLFVNYHGKRKAKCLGNVTREFADKVRREAEKKLIRGELGLMSEGVAPRFEAYAKRWLEQHAKIELKPSSYRSYEQLLRVHIFPVFGDKLLTAITRERVKEFLAEKTGANLARNSVRLILSSMRVIFNHAIEDGVIDRNPAARLGKLTKVEKPAARAQAMTGDQAEQFLDATQEVCGDWYPFFLTALRCGLRKGELIALQWGDINFGSSEADSERYILVQRNYSLGEFVLPKNGKSRRVDLSKKLREVLLQLRENRLLAAFQMGKTSIAEELVFPSEGGTPIKPDNIAKRYMEPALEKAGLRRFRFHDLRHTFGSLLIQSGASLVYVRDQMGHSSIQITVDCYGHLVPGADVANVDKVDSWGKAAGQNATQAQPATVEGIEVPVSDSKDWLPPRDSNPDMLIQSQLSCH